jgi:hypothetical protein
MWVLFVLFYFICFDLLTFFTSRGQPISNATHVISQEGYLSSWFNLQILQILTTNIRRHRMGSSLLRPFPTFEVSLPCLSSQLIFSISFPPSILTRIPLFFSPFYSPFLVIILSHFLSFRMAASRVGELVGSHFYSYSHIMNSTDHRIILYLTVSAVTGWQVSNFHIPCSVTYILYPDDPRSTFWHSFILSPTDRVTTLS